MLALLVSSLALQARAQFQCEHLFPDGTFANLTALFRTPGELDYRSSDDEGNTYVMNVCGVDPYCQNTNSMMCKFNQGGTFEQSVARWGVGRAPEWSTIEGGQGVMLKFTNGDSCTDPAGKAVESTTLLAFTCSPRTDTFSVRRVGCTFMVAFPTVHGCNTRPHEGSPQRSASLPPPLPTATHATAKRQLGASQPLSWWASWCTAVSAASGDSKRATRAGRISSRTLPSGLL